MGKRCNSKKHGQRAYDVHNMHEEISRAVDQAVDRTVNRLALTESNNCFLVQEFVLVDHT